MIYKISHFVQEKLPWAWNMVEWGNGAVFVLQHHKTLKELPVVLEKYSDRFSVAIAKEEDAKALADFFEAISKENLTSIYGARKVLDIKVIGEMDNGHLYVEDLMKKLNGGYFYAA